MLIVLKNSHMFGFVCRHPKRSRKCRWNDPAPLFVVWNVRSAQLEGGMGYHHWCSCSWNIHQTVLICPLLPTSLTFRTLTRCAGNILSLNSVIANGHLLCGRFYKLRPVQPPRLAEMEPAALYVGWRFCMLADGIKSNMMFFTSNYNPSFLHSFDNISTEFL